MGALSPLSEGLILVIYNPSVINYLQMLSEIIKWNFEKKGGVKVKQDNRTNLIKSNFLQIVKDDHQIIIWHSLFGKPKIITGTTLDFVNLFIKPRSLNSVLSEYKIDNQSRDTIRQLIIDYFLIPVGFNERELLMQRVNECKNNIISGSRIKYLELIVSEKCNYRCTYCIHFNNLETTDRLKYSEKIMTFAVARQAINYFLDLLRRHGKKEAEINFGGGEPLLSWSIIEQVLDYCRNEFSSEFKFKFSLNTNASLITTQIAKILKQYNVRVASSLDGLKNANDIVRLTKKGRSTFNLIIKGFDTLAAEGYPLDGITVTIDKNNFQLLISA